MITRTLWLPALSLALISSAQCEEPIAAAYAGWKHTGTLTLLTTPDGADLPAAATLENFPVLVRLSADWFDFKQAKPGGEDLRFSTATGEPLAYQVEEWDAANGTASIWVRMPRIVGNARQTIRAHWGKADAAGESNGKAVFIESNGYLNTWHMGELVEDAVGTLESKDVGTTPVAGMIGKARHLAGKQGVFGGDKIPNYPTADSPHSTSAWFRAERPNSTIIGWGNEEGGRGGKVRMQFRSPPHVRIDSNFSDVKGESRLPMNEWIHVTHTYASGDGRIYINGKLDGSAKPMLTFKSPLRLWIGGWYHNYDFVGDIDEVRISKVTRSADWVRLEYENQKPLQTLVGPIVRPGSTFAVAPAALTVNEGATATLTAEAGGAQKLYWSLIREGRETPLANDRFAFTFAPGRVSGDATATIRLKAVYADGARTKDIPVTIKEAIPEPVFTLKAPAMWNGRAPVEVVPQVSNLAALKAAGAGELKIEWSAAPFAVTKTAADGKLLLTRAQNSGSLTVTATLSNGGTPVSQSTTIAVTEPERDAWAQRVPGADEKPEEGQFYARDDRNVGRLFFNGKLTAPAAEVFLKVYADDQPFRTEVAKPGADNAYALSVELKPGLVKYRVEFGTRAGGNDTVLEKVGNLVCGDAYVVTGQSNAVSTDWGKEEPPTYRSEWIRTFGSTSGNPKGERMWGEAGYRVREGKLQIGYWPMELAKRLVESEKVPICILNGAVGGTRIDQHQRNAADPTDMTTIYGRLLWRAREARLTHGIRGLMWHQGENDQGADGPTGGFGWETYRSYFIELASAWKQDFPNIQHYHIFQIWPKSCAMGVNGSDNQLREVQRTLPSAFSKMSIMSTLGIEPPGGCHFPPAGYAELARVIHPLIARDHYGRKFPAPVTPPNLLRAGYKGGSTDEIELVFDQPVKWDNALAGQFYLDGQKGHVASGTVAGNTLTFKLTAPSKANRVTYLDSAAWSQKTLLRGENGIAALTFCDVLLGDGPDR